MVADVTKYRRVQLRDTGKTNSKRNTRSDMKTQNYSVSKKSVILVDMAIIPLKFIRKGKSWCVSENLA